MHAIKIALIADVHANLYALQAFLDYLSQHPDIEQVWHLGDFLQIGPHPAEVADLILDDPRFLTVMGNNERALLQRDPAGFPAEEIAHQDWTIAQLGEERLARIGELPDGLLLEVGHRRVLLVHEQPPAGGEMHEADLICCGHTHLPSYETRGTMGIMNPGTLGCAHGHQSASFGVVEFTESSVAIRYHALPYDRSALKQDYLQRGVPDCELIFSMVGL